MRLTQKQNDAWGNWVAKKDFWELQKFLSDFYGKEVPTTKVFEISQYYFVRIMDSLTPSDEILEESGQECQD